jgi:broad specificity phosphatase PhoE
LQQNFLNFDFTLVPETKWWYTRPNTEAEFSFEPWEHFENRIDRFVEWLKQQHAQCIVVVTHARFINGCIEKLTGEVRDLIKNCGIVKIEL